MEAQGRRMGFLVVGVGFLGAQRAAAVMAARGARLIAVVDRDPERALAVAGRHGVLAVADLEAGLALPGVEAVIVATPHAEHGEQVRAALEAGKHVLCEKPLTIDADEARDLALIADAEGLRLATGFNHRFYPPIRDAMALVSAWRIGRVESVRAQIGHRASAAFLKSWHTDVSRSGGGTLMDNGPHACDLIRRFLGEVVAAQGYVTDALGLPEGCESEAFALFRNHDRAVAELRSSWTLEAGYLTLEVRGGEGYLRVETAPWRLSGVLAGGLRIERRYLTARAAEWVFRRRFGCERSLVRELEAFVSGDRDHPRTHATGWDGCRATEMIQAVYLSARTGQEVSLRSPHVHLPARQGRAAREARA
ncbi:MAG: Gfo/Idh/MocA family oxidoreductase [Isosphaeraceae bacterium]|nr:Gfo/Idh/MocA family oxidoreductase [Isosphaeraceae bacterium]